MTGLITDTPAPKIKMLTVLRIIHDEGDEGVKTCFAALTKDSTRTVTVKTVPFNGEPFSFTKHIEGKR